MKRKHLVKSAAYWYAASYNPTLSASERLMAMEQCYNHAEGALKYILDKFPDAKKEFERIAKKH